MAGLINAGIGNQTDGIGLQGQTNSYGRAGASALIRQIPILGGVLMAYAALKGTDFVSGGQESPSDRKWDGVGAVLSCLPGGSAEREAAPAENRIILGLGHDLENFRKAMNGTSYERGGLRGTGFGGSEANFYDALMNEYNHIHFSLAAPNDACINPGVAAELGNALKRSDRNVTNWELSIIKNHPEWWDRMTFWQKIDGAYKEVPHPFK